MNSLFNWYYKKQQVGKFAKKLSLQTKKFLAEHINFDLPQIVATQMSLDKTVKFLLRFSDGAQVETVIIPFQHKYSVCLSSQVGCGMNCSFCFTGTQGLKRHLSTAEIVSQLLVAQQWLANERPEDVKIRNIVFMGQGEPLHNFDAVKNACDIFLNQYGFCFADQKITVSTSGYLPGLKRWQQEMPSVNLALSLHSACPEKRNELIPINKIYSLEEVMLQISAIVPHTMKKRFITFEYLMIDGFNDQVEDAHATAKLLQGFRPFVNLIPFNEFPGSRYQRSSLDQILRFKAILNSYQIPATIRTTKGAEILAACGQLNTKNHVLSLTRSL